MRQSIRKLLQVFTLFVLVSMACYAEAGEHEAVLDWAALQVVNFPLDGGVASVYVRAGDRVRQGAKLVELDMEPIEIRISQHAAEVAARKPILADARRDYEHAQSLYEQTVLADVELQRARHAYEKASAELNASRARLSHAQWQKKRASVIAPWDAWVIERNVEPGQMLVAEQRSQPLLVLAKTGVMAARAWLPLASIQQLKTGQPATVLIEQRQYSATVKSLGMRAEEGRMDGKYLLEVEFETDPEHVYRAGQTATIRLP
jgi:multidrug efflux system membrane fusion protein